ncbi:MAG: hypothetical protein K5663_02535 [Clostridiales bacterium]|nr:hypothetical protein [Clostridiales bacterium]
MPDVFIAADDFTGALDTGVKLSGEGISARVVSGLDNMAPCDESVLAANLDTRHMDRDGAYRATYSACAKAFALGVRAVYVKTDSGLRGNIGAYLEAAARAADSRLVFAPAYPALDRRTADGVHMIGDVPVSRSVFGRDLLNPVRLDRTRDIIAMQSELNVYDARHPYDGQAGPSIEILELNTDAAIMSYAEEHAFGPLKAYAGCAGFAQGLGTLFRLKREKRPSARIRLPLAVLTASLNSVNMEQMRRGEASGLYSYRFSDVLEAEPDLDRVTEAVLGRLPGTMIESSRTPEQAETLSRAGEQMGLDAVMRGERIAHNLGRAAKRLIEKGFSGTLCLFGGDCVSAALGLMGCRGLNPVIETEPGVVVSRAYLPDREITLVTKSGGFGSPDVIQTLIRLAEGDT